MSLLLEKVLVDGDLRLDVVLLLEVVLLLVDVRLVEDLLVLLLEADPRRCLVLGDVSL